MSEQKYAMTTDEIVRDIEIALDKLEEELRALVSPVDRHTRFATFLGRLPSVLYRIVGSEYREATHPASSAIVRVYVGEGLAQVVIHRLISLS